MRGLFRLFYGRRSIGKGPGRVVSDRSWVAGPRTGIICTIAKPVAGFLLLGLFAIHTPASPGQTVVPASSDAMDVMAEVFFMDDDFGQTIADPLVVNTRAGRVALLGNGHGSVRGEAVILAVGDIRGTNPFPVKFRTGANDDNGIVARISAIDDTRDGFADFAYAGDLQGNLWKLDMRDEQIHNWKFAFQTPMGPQAFFTARNDMGQAQPITTAVDVMRHYGSRSGYLLLFGTGICGSTYGHRDGGVQSVYALWDWQRQWEIIDGQENAGENRFFGVFSRPGLGGMEKFWNEKYRSPGITGLTLLRRSVSETVRSGGNEYVIMTDRDAAGRQAAMELASKLRGSGIFVSEPRSWPEGKKDPAELSPEERVNVFNDTILVKG